ncbi:MAG: hypothetical protein ACYDCO_01435 [Armatimonadota bacterium]
MEPQTLTPEEVLAQSFLEHRARLLEIAAFLDRLDRAGGAAEDGRLVALQAGLRLLLTTTEDRTAQLQRLWSDPRTEPLDQAESPAACGVYVPRGEAS